MEKENKVISEDELTKVTGGSSNLSITFVTNLMLLVTRYYKEGYTLEQTIEYVKSQIQGTEYNYYEIIGLVYDIWQRLEKEYPDRNIPI